MIDLAKTKGCKCSEDIPVEECVRCICELGSRLLADLPDMPQAKGATERSVQRVLPADMQRDMGTAQGKQVDTMKGGADMACKGGKKKGSKKK